MSFSEGIWKGVGAEETDAELHAGSIDRLLEMHVVSTTLCCPAIAERELLLGAFPWALKGALPGPVALSEPASGGA